MSSVYERLVQERDELQERLTKLKDFLSTKEFLLHVNLTQQVLLYSQSGLMQGYLNTLNKRIELLEQEVKDAVAAGEQAITEGRVSSQEDVAARLGARYGV